MGGREAGVPGLRTGGVESEVDVIRRTYSSEGMSVNVTGVGEQQSRMVFFAM